MPLYEYQCTKCREVCEVLQKAADKPIEKCPLCGGPMVKRISSPAIQFKGNGWYITDYARKSALPPKAPSKAETKAEGPADTKAGSGESAKTKPGKADKTAA
jgi:putative FmdB family regulatory protein